MIVFLSLRCRVAQKWQKETTAPFFREVTSGARHTDCLNMWSIEWNEFREQVARCSIPDWVWDTPTWGSSCCLQNDNTWAAAFPSTCPGAQRWLPVHCGQQESCVREGFWQSSGGHTSVSHSTRPLWQVHWVQESMFHVSPSTKYSPPGAWQMEGVLSSGFCTTKSSRGGHKIKTLRVIPRQSYRLLKNWVLWRTEKMNWPWSTSLCSYQQNSEEKISCVEIRGQTRIVLGSEWGSSDLSLSTIMRESSKRIKLHGEDSYCRDENRGLVGDFCKCVEIV